MPGNRDGESVEGVRCTLLQGPGRTSSAYRSWHTSTHRRGERLLRLPLRFEMGESARENWIGESLKDEKGDGVDLNCTGVVWREEAGGRRRPIFPHVRAREFFCRT